MPRALLANNASTTLSAAITGTGATTFSVASASGFPTPTGSQYFYVTLLDSALIPEVVKVTNVTGTTFTCTRAQDGTSARTFLNGASVKLMANKAVYDEFAAFADPQSWSAAQRGAYVTLADGATITPDFSLANMFRVQLGGNRTLDNPTNLVEGQSGCIDIYQDSTGSRTLAFAWGWDFPSAAVPSLTAVARSKDKLAYQVDVYAQSAVTITIATPGVVSWTAHGLMAGQQVRLTTTGALPTGLAISTTYFVIPVDANSFQLAATQSGTAIATSGSQSGTHTMTAIAITGQLLSGIL